MKKSMFAVVLIVATGAVLFGARATAQVYSKPIPIIGTDTQVIPMESFMPLADTGSKNTSTPAMNVMFFKHPINSAGPNLTGADVHVTVSGESIAIDGVDDVIAIPGYSTDFLPLSEGGLLPFLEDMANEALSPPLTPMNPTHGFCPKKIDRDELTPAEAASLLPSGMDRYVFECDVSQSGDPSQHNVSSREVIVGDVRDIRSGEAAAYGIRLLEEELWGSAEPLGPYDWNTYPKTLMSSKPFEYELGIKLPDGSTRWVSYSKPFNDIYAYAMVDLPPISIVGIGTLPQGVIVAPYDPIRVEKIIRIVLEPGGGATGIYPPDHAKLYRALTEHVGPMFFRKDSNTGKLILSGYLSPNSKVLNIMNALTDDNNAVDLSTKIINGNYLMDSNFNTIDMEAFTNSTGMSTLALVNQAIVGELYSKCIRNDATGYCKTPTHFYSQVVGTKPSSSTTQIRPLQKDDSNPALKSFFPHNTFAYVSFIPQAKPWVVPSAGRGLNPSAVFDTTNSYFAPVGPNMFHATKYSDPLSHKNYLIVASGDYTGDEKLYFYKIDTTPPGPSNPLTLYHDSDPESTTDDVEALPAVLPEQAIEIIPYGPKNVSPWDVITGKFDDNECPDLLFTWRGRYAPVISNLWITPPPGFIFTNDNQFVTYSMTPTRAENSDQRIYANYVSIYYAHPEGGSCKFGGHKDIIFPTPPLKQIPTAVAVPNTTGRDWIILGNLNPEEIEAGVFTGVAWRLKDLGDPTFPLLTNPVADHPPIRLGFTTFNLGPAPEERLGEFLVGWAKEGSVKGVPGVGVLGIDEFKSLVAKIGLPPQLALHNCPKITDINSTFVAGGPGMLPAINFNRITPHVAEDPADGNNIKPMWCLPDSYCAPEGYEMCCEVTSIDYPSDPRRELSERLDWLGTHDECCAVFGDTAAASELESSNPELYTILHDLCFRAVELTQPKKERLAENPKGDGGSNGGGTDFGSKFSLIKEAQAGSPTDTRGYLTPGVYTDITPSITPRYYPWPRGKILGPGEITVVVKEPLPPPSRIECGDGRREGSEVCDGTDGVATCSPYTTCNPDCTCPRCHDGIITTPPEECEADKDCWDPADDPRHGPEWRCVECQCVPPGETGPTCGNNVREGSEACDGTDATACPDRCRPDCTCPEIPPPEIPPPEIPPPTTTCTCCEGTTCPCTCPCTPTTCTPPTTPCTMPATKAVVIKCGGTIPPVLKDWLDKLNGELRQIIRDQGGDPGNNDIACFPEFPWTVQIRQPNGDRAVFAQGMGSVPVDFTTSTKLPMKTLEMPYPQQTILLPLSMEARATVIPDLSASTLATATTISPDLVTNYQAAPAAAGALAQYSYSLNNVVTMSTTTAPVGDLGKAVGVDHVTVTNISYVSQPLLCSSSASCPESELFSDASKAYGKFSIEDLKNVLREDGSKWVGGTNPEMGKTWEKLTTAPTYEKTTFTVVHSLTDGTRDETRGGVIAIPLESVRGHGMGAAGCKCEMNALPLDTASMIAMLIAASIATTGFVVVRVRANKSPSFVRRGKGR